MSITLEEFARRVEQVLGQLEFDVIDELEELDFDSQAKLLGYSGTNGPGVLLNLLKAQRSLAGARRSLQYNLEARPRIEAVRAASRA